MPLRERELQKTLGIPIKKLDFLDFSCPIHYFGEDYTSHLIAISAVPSRVSTSEVSSLNSSKQANASLDSHIATFEYGHDVNDEREAVSEFFESLILVI